MQTIFSLSEVPC